MANQDTKDQAKNNNPVFRLQKLYVKDLSFENPNAPNIFMLQKPANPKVEVNMRLKNQKMENDLHEIVLIITAKVINADDNQTLFILEIEHAGVFLLQNIPEEHMPKVLAVECPTLIFPFTRQIMSQASVDGGFIPFLMEPVNFLGMYENAKKQKQEEQKPQ